MILQIFPNGQLCLPSDGSAVLPGSPAWALQPVNAALIILEAFVVLFTIRDILALCVSMWPCIQRWKPLVSLEHNIQQARMRDKVSFLLLPVLVLVVRGVELRTAPLGWIAAVVLAYYVVRRILYALIPHRKVNSEYWRACMNAASLFSVMLSVLWLLTVGAMVVLGLPQDVVRWVLVGELALCMGLTFIRQAEILASQCGVFLSFLYLCALEIIPATGLVSVLMLVC